MSRIGKKPIPVPKAVEVAVEGPHLSIKGALGELQHEVPPELHVTCPADSSAISVERKGGGRRARAMHGLHRTLIANKVRGVSEGFTKCLEVHGTGYSVDLRGGVLVLQVGFCHEVTFDVPEGITVEIEQRAAQVERPARMFIKGIDKERVGHFAARIRAVRPPEPYKGKGIRYEGEYVRRKEGKAFSGLER
ncbi:MAG: 50S ribosomal protein L6 [Planctomycetota bacterium]|jgi:large subunit ribosomal protein L6